MHPKLYERRLLERLNLKVLKDICEILKVEIRLISKYLERVLIIRDKNRTHQTILYGFLDIIVSSRLGESSREMRFSLPSPTGSAQKGRAPDTISRPITNTDEENSSSDFNQWLHAMKMVARLPGGMPPEFRRKLWLALADKYLKSKNVDWEKEEVKCFSEQWREDDEELGIQIVKDLHRTGSSLCSGPAGTLNQAKLKRILLGYARYNPEVGYCQGFNMLGALILQVMDKEEIESIKVMIYLVEGILPSGYFSGSLGGLQADMAVFRELMTSKLPKLAKHLQKLQGPVENAFEPPLTNVFTMQWFLTMFCTCLPMTCVLRVWDLVLIEGSDVLLRTALVLWSLLEERILNARTADDFYCQMGSFSSELLNGHLVDSNGLIEKVVDLGPVADLQKLRDKHLYNITPFRDKKGLQLYYSDEDGDSDEDSRMAVATAWGLRLRRGSAGLNTKPENKDRIALDISLLKKQYDRLRERQRQAHIILTSAVARQGSNPNQSSIQMNQLLMGRNAIVTNNGRRLGPPQGAIPPARKPSLPATKPPKLGQTKKLLSGETLHWRDTDPSKRRRGSLKWKDIRSDSIAGLQQDDRPSTLTESAPSSRSSSSEPKSKRTTLKASRQRSDSSSYSEESDGNSSTSTSLCDEDDVGDHTISSLEGSPMKKSRSSKKHSEVSKQKSLEDVLNSNDSKPTIDNQIPFIQLTTIESPVLNANKNNSDRLNYDREDSETESNRLDYAGFVDEYSWPDFNEQTNSSGPSEDPTIEVTSAEGDFLSLENVITSTSQLSPIPDITTYINNSTISPLRTPISAFDYANLVESIEDTKKFDVNEEGVTNEYFERVNIVERPTKLDLLYSLNEEDSIRNAYVSVEPTPEESAGQSSKDGLDVIESEDINQPVKPSTEEMERKMKVLLEYSNQSSLSFIAEAKHEISSGMFKDVEFDASSLKYQPSTLVPLKKTASISLKKNSEDTEIMEHVIPVPISPMSSLANDDEKNILSDGKSEDSQEKHGSDLRKTSNAGTSIPEDLEMDIKRDTEKKNESMEMENHTQENSKPPIKNVIPSTEDLEERFRVMEMSFSERKDSLKNCSSKLIPFSAEPSLKTLEAEVLQKEDLIKKVVSDQDQPKDIQSDLTLKEKCQDEAERNPSQEGAESNSRIEVTINSEEDRLDDAQKPVSLGEEKIDDPPMTLEEVSVPTENDSFGKDIEKLQVQNQAPLPNEVEGGNCGSAPLEEPLNKDWKTNDRAGVDRGSHSDLQLKNGEIHKSEQNAQLSNPKEPLSDLQPPSSKDQKSSNDPHGDHSSCKNESPVRHTVKNEDTLAEEKRQFSSFSSKAVPGDTDRSDHYKSEPYTALSDKGEEKLPSKDARRLSSPKRTSKKDEEIDTDRHDNDSYQQTQSPEKTEGTLPSKGFRLSSSSKRAPSEDEAIDSDHVSQNQYGKSIENLAKEEETPLQKQRSSPSKENLDRDDTTSHDQYDPVSRYQAEPHVEPNPKDQKPTVEEEHTTSSLSFRTKTKEETIDKDRSDHASQFEPQVDRMPKENESNDNRHDVCSSTSTKEPCSDQIEKDQPHITIPFLNELRKQTDRPVEDHGLTRNEFQSPADRTSKGDMRTEHGRSKKEELSSQSSGSDKIVKNQIDSDRENISYQSAAEDSLPDKKFPLNKISKDYPIDDQQTVEKSRPLDHTEKSENHPAHGAPESSAERQRASLSKYDNLKEERNSDALKGRANETVSIVKQILPTYSLSYTHDNFGKQASFNLLSKSSIDSSETTDHPARLRLLESSNKTSEGEETPKSPKAHEQPGDLKLSRSPHENSDRQTDLRPTQSSVEKTKALQQPSQSQPSQSLVPASEIVEKSTDLSKNSVQSSEAVERSLSLKLSQSPVKMLESLERSVDERRPSQNSMQNLEIVASTTASQRTSLNDKQIDTIVLKVGVKDTEYSKLNISLSLQMETGFERRDPKNIEKVSTENLNQSLVKSGDAIAASESDLEPSTSSRGIALSMQRGIHTERKKVSTGTDCPKRNSLLPVEEIVSEFMEKQSENPIEKETQHEADSVGDTTKNFQKIKTKDLDERLEALERHTSGKTSHRPENKKETEKMESLSKEELVVTLDDVLPMKLKVDPPSPAASNTIPETEDPVKPAKVIPSTADLEHRFHELERQLSSKSLKFSAKSSVPEENRTLEPSTSAPKPLIVLPTNDSQLDDTASKKSNTAEDQPTPVRKRIPSTEDLETRFQALEIQKSLKSPTSSLLSPSKIQEDFLNSTPDLDSKRKSEIPSTEALENRFQAFEESKKNQNAKKEGKDIETENKTLGSTKKNQSKEVCTKPLTESPAESLGRKENASSDLQTQSHEKETTEKPELLSESSKQPDSALEVSTKSKETTTICVLRREKELRKVPSAKDLEARFDALEKRKSFTEISTKTKETESNSLNPIEHFKMRDKSDKKVASTEDLLSRLDALEERMSITENCIKNKISSKPSDKKVVPSTVDLETRFAALEKRKSFTETSTKTKAVDDKKLSSQDNLTDHLEQHSSPKVLNDAQEKPSEVKSLPSTQDLESRFAALEQQKTKPLSTKKVVIVEKVNDEMLPTKSKPTESVLKTKSSPIRKTKLEQTQSQISFEERVKAEHISKLPSTQDLESRFEALEQQKAKMDSSAKLKDFRPKSSSDIFEKASSPSFTSLLSKSDELQLKRDHYKTSSAFAKPSERISTKHQELLREHSGSLSKVPSTHDLEKRFNELQIDTKRGDETVEPEEVLNEADTSMEITGYPKRRDLYKLESQSDETLTASDPRSSEFDAKTESRPTSCPEYRDAFDSNIVTTDRVLKIIEENSKILHRILKKTLADNSDSGGRAQPVGAGFTDSLLALGNIFPRSSEDSISPSRIKSQSRVRSTITFRSDDSITDRLASIKSTIKSIDTLCEEKTFRKDKCQRYIDSLFTPARPNLSTSTSPIPPAKPLIRVDDFESKSRHSSQERLHTRELRKEASPRRRRDEDREEYESRVRRDMMPNSLDAPSEISCSLENITKVDSEVDRINQDKQVETQLERPLSPYYASPNDRSITPVVYIPTKLEIRHTTVTSTFYDRYLTEKHMERTFPRSKKSPVSPTAMTKSYLDISNYASPELDRSSKSAENSPSRRKGGLSPNEIVPTSGNNKRTFISTLEVAQKDLQIRSCDNILLQLKSSALNNDIVPSIMVYNPLPTKIRKPPELGISLGLYKDYGSDAASKS